MYVYPRRSPPLGVILALPVVIVLGLAATQLFLRPLPAIEVTASYAATSVIGEPANAALPEAGSAIVAVDGLGTLAKSGPETPRPIASVTKIMTAYLILKLHPLQPGQPGPLIAITARDVTRYQEMLRQDQSSLAVSAGQQFTQLQLLQGALVPSANNFAEILANWDAGSVAAFVEKMNAEAQALGMTNTRYADVSGFAAGSVSTPADQLILARVAMRNPVFASIVGTETLQLPGIGPVSNVNQLLGEGGVIGIKTGFTEEAGGNLAFAARRQLEGQEVTIFGVVLGQTTRPHAFDATRGILNSISQNLRYARVIPARQPVATLDTPWGDPVDVILGEDVQMLFWPGMTLETSVEIDAIEAPLRGGSQLGWLNLRLGEQAKRVPLFLAEDLPGPGLFWRLTRI